MHHCAVFHIYHTSTRVIKVLWLYCVFFHDDILKCVFANFSSGLSKKWNDVVFLHRKKSGLANLKYFPFVKTIKVIIFKTCNNDWILHNSLVMNITQYIWLLISWFKKHDYHCDCFCSIYCIFHMMSCVVIVAWKSTC